MGLTLLAQECKIGSTTYYLANVKANTLIQNVGYASEMENWSDMTIDERMQREIKGDRVAEEIVPYIVNDSDWFFGALIVDIYKGWEKVKFQGIKDVVEVKFDAYDNTLDNAGFLTLPDDKSLIALDGQHRLAALNLSLIHIQDTDSEESQITEDEYEDEMYGSYEKMREYLQDPILLINNMKKKRVGNII